MLGQVITGVVAALHVYFLVLEMFLWATPIGQKTFKRSAAEQESTKVLAANQGLYNGFLAAGLIASFFVADARDFRFFFFTCVVVAGVFGGFTVSKRILVLQALPAAIGLAAMLALRGA